MYWFIIGAAIWVALGLPVAVIIGRSIRQAEVMERRKASVQQTENLVAAVRR